jgi:ParB family chromosome partitioning protein
MNSLSKDEKNISSIPIAKVSPNLRICFSEEEIVALCHSIRLQGQRDPITVFFDGESFKIIDGEKRWRACKRLGVTHLNVVITEIFYSF